MDLKKADLARGLNVQRAFRLLAMPAAVALTAALTGCGGGSNNLPDPTSTSETTTSCKSTGSVTCVTAQFIVDAPVVGLSYQCGTVSSVTDNTGTVSCPDQTTATFSIQGANKGKKITLGSYRIQANRDIGRTATGGLVSITPLDLVSLANTSPELSDSLSSGAVNIAQLLETLRSSSSAYNPNEPTSRLILDSKTLSAINLLATDLAAIDIVDGSYVSKIQPVLTNLNIKIVSTADTLTRQLQGLNALQAGVYYTPVLSLTLLDGSSLASVQTLANSSVDLDKALLSLHNVIDRSGFAIGQGVEWNGSIESSSTKGQATPSNLQTKKDSIYTKLILTGSKASVAAPDVNVKSFLNPVNDFLTASYIWQPQAVKLSDAGEWLPQPTTPLGNAVFSNGRLIGGTYVVGTQVLWQNVSNLPSTTVAPVTELATWTQDFNSVAKYYTGTLTLNKTRSVNTFLDSEVFTTADNVGKGNAAIFPLHMVLTFSKNASTCTSNCTLGTQAISILANGNIVSDMNNDCSAVNQTTLIDANNVQEYRVGLLVAAFKGQINPADHYISPILMFSGSQFGALDGIQVATLSLSKLVKINVVGATRGNINISDNTNVTQTDGNGVTTVISTGEQSTQPATFVNFYDIWNLLKQNSTQAAADEIVTARSTGTVTAKLSSCYVPPIGK